MTIVAGVPLPAPTTPYPRRHDHPAGGHPSLSVRFPQGLRPGGLPSPRASSH